MAINQTQRFIRKTLILAKVETQYGVEPTFAGSDALLVSNVQLSYVAGNQPRDVIRPHFGASEEVAVGEHMTLSFETELAPSGTAGTAPAWGALLRGCGMAQTITALTNVVYNPVSASFESLAFSYVLDGVRYKVGGARGTVELAVNVGEIPRLRWSFTCLYGGVAAESPITPDYAAWKMPEAVSNANSADMTLGGAYAAGAVTGGEVYACRGFTLNLGNSVAFQEVLGAQRVLITDRQASGQITFDLSAADEVAFRSGVSAATVQSASLEHGTAAGKKALIWMPKMQLTNPTVVDVDGVAMTQFDMRVIPSAGNDDLLIICK